MEGGHQSRIAVWMRWSLAITLATGAAFAYLGYMANGMAVGDMIGLAGREADIAAAQRNATRWLWTFVGLQGGVVTAIFSMLRFDAEAESLPRFVSRCVAAVFLSVPGTLSIGVIVFGLMRLMFHHGL